MEALIGFDARVIEGLTLDFTLFQAFPGGPTKRLLAQPIMNAGTIPQLALISELLLKQPGSWGVWEAWVRDFWLGAAPGANIGILTEWDPNLWVVPAELNEFIESQLDAPDAEEAGPEDVGDQEPTSIGFTITVSGQIDVDPQAMGTDLVQNKLATDLHAELLSLAGELSEACTTSNLLVSLGRSLDRFRNSLGANPSELQAGFAVPRGNALRGELEVDERRRATSDPDIPALPEGIAGALKQVVQVWNIYVANDPTLDGMDSDRFGPDSMLQGHGDIRGATEAASCARRQELATVAAADALDEVSGYATGDTRAAKRAQAFLSSAFRNFARQAMRVALYALKNGRKVVGAAAAAGGAFAAGMRAIAWIHENVGFLRQLLAEHPNLLTWLERLIQATGGTG